MCALVADLRERGFSGRTVLVDGSQYSPSWRALDGGANVWELGTEAPSLETTLDLTEAYTETLDRYCDEAGAYWEDGCLWWASDEFDHEADEDEDRSVCAECGPTDEAELERVQRVLALRLAPSPNRALGLRLGTVSATYAELQREGR